MNERNVCSELEKIIQDTIDKNSLIGRLTKPLPISEQTGLPESQTFLVTREVSIDFLMKTTVLSNFSETAFLDRNLFEILLWIDKKFILWMKENACKKQVTFPKERSSFPSLRKEYILSNSQNLIAEDFKDFSMPLRETVYSGNLLIQIGKSDLFRVSSIGSFIPGSKRILSDETFVSISDNLETSEVLSFAYDFLYFPRPQIEVTEIQENMYQIQIYFWTPKPEDLSVKPILYQYE